MTVRPSQRPSSKGRTWTAQLIVAKSWKGRIWPCTVKEGEKKCTFTHKGALLLQEEESAGILCRKPMRPETAMLKEINQTPKLKGGMVLFYEKRKI